jgi:hypothetical protein
MQAYALPPRIPAAVPPGPSGLARLFGAEPSFAAMGLLLVLSLPLTLAALALDPRQFGGQPIWLKPIKFQVALSVYLLTLAWMARFLPPGLTARPLYRAFSAAVVVAVLAEIAWIGGAAALGTASHFNVSTPLWSALYGLMGLFAVLLTSASLVFGIAVLADRRSALAPALRIALGLGLVSTFVLTVAVAAPLSANGGHLVGVPSSGAAMPLFGWSREVGDLRVAHFFATHALHVVPLLGLLATRLLPPRPALAAVVGAAALYALFVLAVFAQALAGQPFA